MKVKILLDGHDIWRRILIPSRCTFRRLHRVIQETFGWFDYHLHEFTVPDEYEVRHDNQTNLREKFSVIPNDVSIHMILEMTGSMKSCWKK